MILWALMDAMDREGVRVQSYRSQACFAPVDAATSITGVNPRHLDSWLMSPEQCRRLFLRSAGQSDLAVIDGQFDSAVNGSNPGGRLEPLCQWLGLPRIAVVDVTQLANCHLPIRPERAAGLLLDGVADRHDYYRWQTVIESLWGIPVLGGLPLLSPVRDAVRRFGPGDTPARDLCRSLGNELLRYLSPAKILKIASHGDFSSIETGGDHPDSDELEFSDVRIAVAYDDAFHCYFPDTLEALEARGATVVDFSPLRDEALPADTDLVYIGCGHPEQFAGALTENHCLKLALRDHLCAGKRFYAEGGGLAYLCQNMVLSTGQWTPMLGILPGIARQNSQVELPRPVEVALSRDTWLGQQGTQVRGYLNESWSIEPDGRLSSLAQNAGHEFDLVGRHQAIGSRLHLNFATQPKLLQGFLQPCPAALAWAGAR